MADFSPGEVALAQRSGVHLVRLGRSILRSETAAIVALVQDGTDTNIVPLFVAVTPTMILTDHDGQPTLDDHDTPDAGQGVSDGA